MLEDLYGRHVPHMAMDIQVENLVCTDTSAVVMMDEEERRIQETLDIYGSYGVDTANFKEQKATLLLNYGNPLVHFLAEHPDHDLAAMICNQLYDLGRLGQETLEADDMVAFIERTNRLLQMIL